MALRQFLWRVGVRIFRRQWLHTQNASYKCILQPVPCSAYTMPMPLDHNAKSLLDLTSAGWQPLLHFLFALLKMCQVVRYQNCDSHFVAHGTSLLGLPSYLKTVTTRRLCWCRVFIPRNWVQITSVCRNCSCSLPASEPKNPELQMGDEQR